LIAKIIAHGDNRAEAIARMRRGLDGFVVEGIKTTIPLHKRILADPDFIAGKFDTHFLDRRIPVAAK
jgi:acetyl-CoA carboxylase biotin carboxylase subunit